MIVEGLNLIHGMDLTYPLQKNKRNRHFDNTSRDVEHVLKMRDLGSRAFYPQQDPISFYSCCTEPDRLSLYARFISCYFIQGIFTVFL